MKPVCITWRDAHAVFCSWSEPDSIDTADFTCQTVGWLLPKETKPSYHVVVLSKTHEGLVGDGIAIPDENIIKVEVFTRTKSAKQQECHG